MSRRLDGKVAFCTASGAGIGRATAIAFAREGAKVIATDIDLAKLKGLSEAGIAETHLLDVRHTRSVEAIARKIGPVDILFNAAGFVHHGTVLECTDKDWDFSFNLNVRSHYVVIRTFLPAMLAGGGGSIESGRAGKGPRELQEAAQQRNHHDGATDAERPHAADHVPVRDEFLDEGARPSFEHGHEKAVQPLTAEIGRHREFKRQIYEPRRI